MTKKKLHVLKGLIQQKIAYVESKGADVISGGSVGIDYDTEIGEVVIEGCFVCLLGACSLGNKNIKLCYDEAAAENLGITLDEVSAIERGWEGWILPENKKYLNLYELGKELREIVARG